MCFRPIQGVPRTGILRQHLPKYNVVKSAVKSVMSHTLKSTGNILDQEVPSSQTFRPYAEASSVTIAGFKLNILVSFN